MIDMQSKIYTIATPQFDRGEASLSELVKALTHINRFAGSAGKYSVASHCLLVREILRLDCESLGTQLAGLVHDLHEAVIGDIITPVKDLLKNCKEFNDLEDLLVAATEDYFSVDIKTAAVKRADLIALTLEMQALTNIPCARNRFITVSDYDFKRYHTAFSYVMHDENLSEQYIVDRYFRVLEDLF